MAPNKIILRMERNATQYIIGNVLFENIETIFSMISENVLLWECLPIT